MLLQGIVSAIVLLLCSAVAAGDEPVPEKKVFSYKDANGNPVFSDKQDEGGEVLRIRQLQVVTDSQLGKKVEYAPPPPDKRELHAQVLERERMEAKCGAMSAAVYAPRGARSTSRRALANRYDRECIGNGY